MPIDVLVPREPTELDRFSTSAVCAIALCEDIPTKESLKRLLARVLRAEYVTYSNWLLLSKLRENI